MNITGLRPHKHASWRDPTFVKYEPIRELQEYYFNPRSLGRAL